MGVSHFEHQKEDPMFEKLLNIYAHAKAVLGATLLAIVSTKQFVVKYRWLFYVIIPPLLYEAWELWRWLQHSL
jgi:hypothetical protein